MNKVRNHAIKLSPDYIGKTSETLWADVNHLCLKKGPDGSQIVFCINNKSSKGSSYTASIGGFKANDKVVDVLRCKTVTADGTGNITMYMGQGEPRVYVKATTLKDTGLCTETQEDGPIEEKSGAAALGMTGGLLFAAVFGWGLLFA